jgi:hypothetical protein
VPLRSIRSRLIGLVVASILPFTALIGVGLWNQWRIDHDAALQRAVDDARVIAGRVDDHLSNVRNLLAGLSVAVSWNPEDTDSNDRLLRRVKAELPSYFANLLVFSLDGTNIGSSSDSGRFFAGDRDYFKKIVAGANYSVSGATYSRAGKEWVVAITRPIVDTDGRLRAVLAVGTRLERFQSTLMTAQLPPGSVIRVVDENLIVIAHTIDGPNWIGQNLEQFSDVDRHFAAKTLSEVARWSDDVSRITGSVRAEQMPWMVSVGLPVATAGRTIPKASRRAIAWEKAGNSPIRR